MAKKSKKTSKTLRVGVVGVGGMGAGHCNSLKRVRGMKLVAVCDIVPEIAEQRAEQFDVPYYLDHKDLLKADVCDVVTIATPHPSHGEIAVNALKAGNHVLTEKPMSERVSVADRMVKTAKKEKKVLAVMFQRRFEPAFRKALDLVESGALGKIHRATMISPEYRSQAYYDSGGWRATWEGEGGGVMMNQSPHILDLFVHLGGVPKTVRGSTETRMHHIEVEDYAEATLSYPDGGTGYFTCSTCEAGPGQMIEIYGDEGKLCWRNGELRFWKFEKPVSKFTKESKEMWGGPPCKEVTLRISKKECGHFSVMRNMAAHILKGEPLLCAGETGIASLELANAVTLSSHTGEEVKLPLSRRKYDALLKDLRKNSTFKKRVRAQTATDPNLNAAAAKKKTSKKSKKSKKK